MTQNRQATYAMIILLLAVGVFGFLLGRSSRPTPRETVAVVPTARPSVGGLLPVADFTLMSIKYEYLDEAHRVAKVTYAGSLMGSDVSMYAIQSLDGDSMLTGMDVHGLPEKSHQAAMDKLTVVARQLGITAKEPVTVQH